MASAIKYDDGTSFISNCFPVRRLHKENEEDGAWLVAYRAEQRRQFKAIVCAKQPKTYSRLREERRKLLSAPQLKLIDTESAAESTIDGFYLLKHCCVEDPSDLCSVNVSSCGLSSAREDDFQLFESVAYVNASDNRLNLEIFDKFPAIRELEVSVNGISSVTLTHNMFTHLEVLDLSYNNLPPDGVLELGCLRKLKVLYLTGNNLSTLPVKMAASYRTGSSQSVLWRFPSLEVLVLDHNELDHMYAFAPLAGLKKLKHLSLEHNRISSVPHLQARAVKSSAGDVVPTQDLMGATEDNQKTSNDARKEPDMGPALIGTHTPSHEHQDTQKDSDVTVSEHGPSASEKPVETQSNADGAIPFPELRFLSLACNAITTEEDLLPVAAWPSLEELFLHGNPLIDAHRGDPPLLKKFLQDELGINVFRKKPILTKPVFDVPFAKPGRRVKTTIPPIPRLNVEKVLALEAPEKKAIADAKAHAIEEVEHSAAASSELNGTVANFTSITEEAVGGSVSNAAAATTSQSEHDTFFMTQVDDAHNKESDLSHVECSPLDSERKETACDDDPKKRNLLVAKYKEYQALFDDSEEDCLTNVQLPQDLSTSVKVLRHILAHPVTYRENQVQLEKRQRTYEPYERKPALVTGETLTGTQKVARALEKARLSQTVSETPLSKALTDPSLRTQYPEADKLLKQIQRKYATARADSLKEAKEVRSAIQGAMMRAARLRDETTSMTGLPSLGPSN